MEQEGADTLVERAKGALSFAVLLASVWAGKPEDRAAIDKEGAHSSVVELASVIGLQGQNGALELSLGIGIKGNNHRVCIGFMAQSKGSHIV